MTNIFKLAIIFINLLLIFPIERNNSEIDYFSLGYEKGCYYQEICKQYFHTSSHIYWLPGEEEKQFSDNESHRMFIPITGLKKDGEILETDYEWVKEYFKGMGISEHAFEQFQQNAHGAYYEIDGELYVGIIDGGEWGWDYAYIDSYELPDSDTIQYNCIVKSHADYDDRPFTFTLKSNNGVWELYECSDPYAFAAYFKNPVKIAKQIQLETSAVTSNFLKEAVINSSQGESEVNEQVKYYLDNYALTAACFDYETGGYTLNCTGCGYSEENNLSVSEILEGAAVYQSHGINITGLYIEMPVKETADIGIFENLVEFECISNDVSGLKCTKSLDKLKSFVLRYVQGQSESALIDVCRIIEQCPELEYFAIDGIYADRYPELAEYLSGLYPVEIYDEAIQYNGFLDVEA